MQRIQNMATYYITCKVHDSQKRVIKVGIGGNIYDKDTVWGLIKNQHEVFVSVGGRQVHVHALTTNGYKYLHTSPDGYSPNNLDNLPDCV